MLSSAAFDEQLHEICRSGPPSGGDDLLGMEIDFMVRLGDPTYADTEHELWDETDVRRGDGGEWLIRASATARPGVTSEEVGECLSKVWMHHLRYHYRQAHIVQTEATSVTLRAVTQVDPGGFWVTAEVRVVLKQPSITC